MHETLYWTRGPGARHVEGPEMEMRTVDPEAFQQSEIESYRSFLLLVAMPGAPSSVLAPSSKARSP